MSIPIIDLFAGAGGLAEGFASLRTNGVQPDFRIGISVEKDAVSHKTLLLRAVFRLLRETPALAHYYQYMRGELSEAQFKAVPEVSAAFEHAGREALCLELGKNDHTDLDGKIRSALGSAENWVLIGGPPCQAYSVAGRSRRANDESFKSDEKHLLYKEYLRVIQVHRPAVFVMENVKGMLSSKHGGTSIFERILADLGSPCDGLKYEIRSFVKRANSARELKPADYVIEAEKFGIPQCRHRVILFGVREDIAHLPHRLLQPAEKQLNVRQAIGDLPRIRSRLSRLDSFDSWHQAVSRTVDSIRGWGTTGEEAMCALVGQYVQKADRLSSTGSAFHPYFENSKPRDASLRQWFLDAELGGYCQHESRSHMPADLARYMFAACFAKTNRFSPGLDLYPPELLPNHKNASEANEPITSFKDRFRVQCAVGPATTVVSHIAKDGHYYIHYDPTQCRSLTVREAARLQTFPDNYFFVGTRTQQYTQIGNAVPPLLSAQVARIVRSLIVAARKNVESSGFAWDKVTFREELVQRQQNESITSPMLGRS